nr:UvrD-like helicase, ATP-binding domain, P-loop containing nucleoside triphosphate hydrolase [Tanacetum cinerariifolium]
SKEDLVTRISKSVFVTNFSDKFGPRDLWKLCEAYSKVVDVFIPNRKSKAGKRFAFVRFIKVSNVDRLIAGTYANVVKDIHAPPRHVTHSFNNPAVVLDDSCFVERDLLCHVMGKVKELSSIQSLSSILAKEGFLEVKLSYLGGMWVLLEFDTVAIKDKVLCHTGVNSWFSVLQAATNDFSR